MMNARTLLLLGCACLSPIAVAQVPIAGPVDVPIVTLTASATAQVDNDRMTLVLQSESQKPQAAAAAAEVNTKMNRAMSIAKATPGVTAKTVNYTTEQAFEKGRMVGWRVRQFLQVETGDFTAGANLATRLQEEGLLLSSLTFSVSPEARRASVAKLQHDALVEWQSLAKAAAASMGYADWKPGRVNVNANDEIVRPHFAARAMVAAAPAPEPVAVAGGSSEIVVNVNGEAILAGARRP